MGLIYVLWGMSVIIGTILGYKKGNGIVSFIGCSMFGPFWLIAILLTKGRKAPCPKCKEMMNRTASICPHCRSEILAGELK